MKRSIVLVIVLMALAGCGRTISCETDLGMCHEWVDASPGLRREIAEAVCRKSDERFAERPCPRAGVVGVCEMAGGRERTLWYERGGAGDPAAICRDSGGRFAVGPAR